MSLPVLNTKQDKLFLVTWTSRYEQQVLNPNCFGVGRGSAVRPDLHPSSCLLSSHIGAQSLQDSER